jgi:hypothetical protein
MQVIFLALFMRLEDCLFSFRIIAAEGKTSGSRNLLPDFVH